MAARRSVRALSAIGSVVYWDASAILSSLFLDAHSKSALSEARDLHAAHLISSLAWSETHAIIARIERERRIATALVRAAREALEGGPWRYLSIAPRRDVVAVLARRWPLRGADLWHLAAAKTLQRDISTLRFLSYDTRLVTAARGENLM